MLKVLRMQLQHLRFEVGYVLIVFDHIIRHRQPFFAPRLRLYDGSQLRFIQFVAFPGARHLLFLRRIDDQNAIHPSLLYPFSVSALNDFYEQGNDEKTVCYPSRTDREPDFSAARP